jgi:hypothetical protein
MEENKMLSMLSKAKKTRNILAKAGFKMGGISLNTSKNIIRLYKDTGLKTFKMSVDLTKKTVDLLIRNHQEMVKTSGESFKEIVRLVEDKKGEIKISPNGNKSKSFKKFNKKRDISIDEVIEESMNPT